MKNPVAALWYVLPLLKLVSFSSACIKVSKTQYDRVWSYIESGKKQGARIIVGGERRTTPGYWVDATSSLALLHRSLNADSRDSIHRHSPRYEDRKCCIEAYKNVHEILFLPLGRGRGVADPPNFTTPYTDILVKIFGPVLSVGKFHTEQEAIDLANDTNYGLAAGLHSSISLYFRPPPVAHNFGS